MEPTNPTTQATNPQPADEALIERLAEIHRDSIVRAMAAEDYAADRDPDAVRYHVEQAVSDYEFASELISRTGELIREVDDMLEDIRRQAFIARAFDGLVELIQYTESLEDRRVSADDASDVAAEIVGRIEEAVHEADGAPEARRALRMAREIKRLTIDVLVRR